MRPYREFLREVTYACGDWRLQADVQCRSVKQEATGQYPSGIFVYELRNGGVL